MIKDKWTIEEQARGYAAMAELNLALAREFFALEEEAAALLDKQFMVHD